MPCYRPFTVWKNLDGGPISFSEKKDHREIQIPCGQCIGCRVQKTEAWAFRCYAESMMHRDNMFITLTYDDDHLPADESVNHRDWQLFAKRLRERVGPFRFMMCGEYGENTKRPHYHGLVFGYRAADLVKCNSVYSKHDIYESDLLSEVWGKGMCVVGEVNFATARYVSAYICKRVTGEKAQDHYNWVTRYGELVQRRPEYGKMSLRPGIGASWFEKFWPECLVHDGVHVQNKKKKIPVFFDNMMAKIDPDKKEEIDETRVKKAVKFIHERTRERLEVREKVAIAKRNFDKERYQNAL